MNMRPDSANHLRTIQYKLRFSEAFEKTFSMTFDPVTMDMIQDPKVSYPPWTRLSCQKCANCPLEESRHKYCPIAVKISDIVDFFCKPIAFEHVTLTVQTPERSYTKVVDFPSATASLIGVYMVTSGCPVMDKLRPMARFHLPFATTQETTYRSIANYLMAQYIACYQGKPPDWELKTLSQIYTNIKTVNQGFGNRLQEIHGGSSALNAIFTLDTSAYYINLSLRGQKFYSLEGLFGEESAFGSISFKSREEEEIQPSEESLRYEYQFQFDNEYVQTYSVTLDPRTLKMTGQRRDSLLPSWTELDCKKCTHCPLEASSTPHCPAAVAISDTIDFLRETMSPGKVLVSLEIPERVLSQHTDVADGLSSIIGLIMPTSGCPVLGRLKPLARQHLPFETPDETFYRCLGMYLVRQKLLAQSGGSPDWTLKNFDDFFKEVDKAAKTLRERLMEITIEEDLLSILTGLDCFQQYSRLDISEDRIKNLHQLFQKSL